MARQHHDGTKTMKEISVLCAERVSQMTKTYNDIEAVTRLLEEKERDLELAARIGQTLLSKNKELSSKSENLEEQLSQAQDAVSQLRHDLSMKDELLKFYHEDLEHEGAGDSTPSDVSGQAVGNVDHLHKKVKTLEDENLNLRLETAQLKSHTDSYEEKEKRLVEDCIEQLADVNIQVEALAEELSHKVEENVQQKDEITNLLYQVAELQKKIRKLTLENMDLHEKFTASSESQRKLTKELGSMQDKYDELFEMLEEAQDELRIMRGKTKIRANGQHYHAAYAVPTDSLASELENSLQLELSQSNRRAQSWKVFETAKAAKRAAAKAAKRDSLTGPRMAAMEAPSLQESDSASQGVSTYPSDVESFVSDGYSADMDSLYGSNPELGRPGIPGSNDLESALKRLATRKANEMNERDFMEEEERRKKKGQLATTSGATSPYTTKSPLGIKSPGSTSSNWSSNGLGANGQPYKISDKLQIVKPMEGSMTLRQWQHLATPHLGGIFEERDGVQMKGEKKLDLVEEVYNLSDFEEDDDPHDIHTRKEEDRSLIYTFTDSTVTNPGPYRGIGTLFTPIGSRVPSTASLTNMSMTSEDQPIQASTPRPESHLYKQSQLATDNTQSTYSMSLGLAALLQGRDNTGTGRAIMRASPASRISKGGESTSASTKPVSSTPTTDLNQRILSSRSLGSLPPPSSFPPSSTHNLPGSRSFDQAMKEHEEKMKIEKPELFPPGMTGQSFLQQLKNKGYSLYGLWAGTDKGEAATSQHPDSSTDVQLGTSCSTVSQTSSTQTILSSGSGGGVLGALTNLRRGGML